MFYEEKQSKALRFGDILPGFVFVEAEIADPKNQQSYKIDVKNHSFCVVMTPCCSIRNKVLSITPLSKIRSAFFDNPYFADDLTNINRIMKPEQAVAPRIWESFPPEVKAKRLKEGETYAFPDVFIYGRHDRLPSYSLYSVGKREDIYTNYYLIDFKNICTINCDKVNTPEDSPYDMKVLELSTQVRNELRNKLGDFFKRTPIEDKSLED